MAHALNKLTQPNTPTTGRNPLPAQSVGFAGAMPSPATPQQWQRALTWSMEKLDESKIRELIITDTLLMVLPRTTIEGVLRDKQARWDAVREVLMREILSTVAMVLLMPAIGQGVSKMFDRLPKINPQALFTQAWINEYVLRHGMRHYKAVLAEFAQKPSGQLTPQALRQAVVQRLLLDVESGDATLLNGLKTVCKDLPANVVARITPNTAQATKALTPLFALNHAQPTQGIFPIDSAVNKLIQAQAQLGHPCIKANPTQAPRFAERLTQSLKDTATYKPWLAQVQRVLNQHQLGDKLAFGTQHGQRQVLSQAELMMSMRHFVQQIVDRSLAEATRANAPLRVKQLEQVAVKLADATHGAKNWITWLPFILALVGGRLVPTLINGLSRMLHGGKQYFPGDVALATNKPTPNKANPLSGLHKNNQVFAGFVASPGHAVGGAE
jgi:hypothetical protein